MSRGYTGERLLVGFYSDPHDGGYFPCLSVVFRFVVFDGNITSKTQKFLLSWSDSRCYTVFVPICTFYPTTFCLAPLSVFSIYIKFCLLSCSPLFGHCTQKSSKSLSSTTPVVKRITLVFEVNPLKILRR